MIIKNIKGTCGVWSGDETITEGLFVTLPVNGNTTRKNLKVSRNFNFTMSYRYDILSKTTLCTAVFYTVQTEQAGDFLGPGRKATVD